MVGFAYLDNQDTVLGTVDIQSPVTFGLNGTVHRSYCFVNSKAECKNHLGILPPKAIDSELLKDFLVY